MSTSKQFAKGKREVPREDTRASKYYSVDDELNSKKVRKSVRPTQYRSSLQPGTVLILLAGRFRGKRVILLRCLSQGLLLVTGPYKVNGVPIRRVNARYVIATRTSVKLDGVDEKVIGKLSKDEYFTEKTKTDKGENAFYKQAEKREPKPVSSARAEDQKSIDKAILGNLKRADPALFSYLASTFSLRRGDRPHAMVF